MGEFDRKESREECRWWRGEEDKIRVGTMKLETMVFVDRCPRRTDASMPYRLVNSISISKKFLFKKKFKMK